MSVKPNLCSFTEIL